MGRRAMAFSISCLLLAISAAVCALVPLPFSIMVSGHTINVLGSYGGTSVVQVGGGTVSQRSGQLNLIATKTDEDPTVFLALEEIFSGGSVVPESDLLSSGLTFESLNRIIEKTPNLLDIAIASAFRVLKTPFSVDTRVLKIEPGVSAAHVLKTGDLIESVDGREVSDSQDLQSLISRSQVGQTINMTFSRRHTRITSRLTMASDATGRPTLGISTSDIYHFPRKVEIDASACEGSGCTLMYALAVVEKVGHLDLTGKMYVAGVGSVDSTGKIGPPAFNIKYLLPYLPKRKEVIFLTPAIECNAAMKEATKNIELVKVTTLAGAVSSLQALKSGRQVEQCNG